MTKRGAPARCRAMTYLVGLVVWLLFVVSSAATPQVSGELGILRNFVITAERHGHILEGSTAISFAQTDAMFDRSRLVPYADDEVEIWVMHRRRWEWERESHVSITVWAARPDDPWGPPIAEALDVAMEYEIPIMVEFDDASTDRILNLMRDPTVTEVAIRTRITVLRPEFMGDTDEDRELSIRLAATL